MLENVNELIETNLNLIAETKNNELFHYNFIQENGRPLTDTKKLAELMQKKKLIEIEPKKGWRCDLTEFGYKIIHDGGWIKYIESKNKADKKKADADNERKALETNNLKLQNENLDYSKSVREQEAEISRLTTLHLELQNKQMKRHVLFAVVSFLAGALITNLKDILDLF